MGNTVEKKYKDKLFRMIFKEKDKLLSLYNAVNKSNYTNPEELEIVTLENAIYMNMKNDLAYLIDDWLNVYEHKSTVNLNMPLRDLVYVAKEYRKLTAEESLYSTELIKLPSPRFIVFYNGTRKQPEKQVLKLSDAYEKITEDPELELRVTVLNINAGYNTELLEACQTLKEYSLRAEGLVEGRAKNIIEMIYKKIQREKTLEAIADELEEELEVIRPVYEIVKAMGESFDCDKLYEQIYK